jgi:hypothetical protein
MKKMWRIILVTLLVLAMLTSTFATELGSKAASNEKVYVGVTFGGTTVEEAKQLIDKVSSYTNLFIVASWTIDGAFNDSTPLTDICDYAVQHNLSVIVYFSFIYYNYTRTVGNLYNSSVWDLYGVSPWHVGWLNQANERWGDMFLGAYLYDEPGGKQIDTGYWGGNMTTFTGGKITSFVNTTSYADAARRFTRGILTSGSMQHIINSSIPDSVTSPIPVYTSDYALYWFDYKAGYNTVFVELGNNSPINTKIQQIALCRGAAKVQNKDWGAIVTLANNEPPVPENGSTVFNDMTMAYEAGAKYISVFNYELNGQGILTEEHFNAMKQFWDNIHSSSADSWGKSTGQVAFVLPTDYGWGMRHINDRIWGLWDADNKSTQIWDNLNKLTDKYGLNLDIVYEDQNFSIQGLYSQTYLWNSTINFGTTLNMPNQMVILFSVVGSVGAVACLSTYWFTKRRKQKPTKSDLKESSSIQQAFLEHPSKPIEKLEFNSELNGVFNTFANILDPLFDLLMDLNGQVNWNEIDNCLTRCKLAKAIGAKQAIENINFQNLSAYIKTRKSKDTSQETKSLIKQLHENASVLGPKESVGESQSKFDSMKSAIFSYFFLNDILLGQILGDESAAEERIKLGNTLNELQLKAKNKLFTQFIVLLKKKGNNISIDESRTLLRKLLNEFIEDSIKFGQVYCEP